MSQTVDRALMILVDLGTGPKSLDQVAALLGVHKSTALRLLQTLEQRRFVRHDERHRYRLGSGLFALAQQALDDIDVRQVAAPHLADLNRAHGHTVHLAAYLDGTVVYIDKYDSRHPVRMYSRIGATAPAHCTAVGKVLLAGLPAVARQAAAEALDYPLFTANTITDPDRYLAELGRVAAQGYARDHAEHEDYINCVAVPIRDASGAVLAAASISVPDVVLAYEGVFALLPDLLAAADAASAELGWTGRVPGRRVPTPDVRIPGALNPAAPNPDLRTRTAKPGAIDAQDRDRHL
jgi:DNA-binding IclR family transcriptional regulator